MLDPAAAIDELLKFTVSPLQTELKVKDTIGLSITVMVLETDEPQELGEKELRVTVKTPAVL